MLRRRLCDGRHWAVIEGQLFLSTEKKKEDELARQVIKVLEHQIRERIYAEIMDWNPIADRKRIMRVSGSIDTALLGVQAICADIVKGKEE